MKVDVLPEDYTPFEDLTERTRGDGVCHLTDIIRDLDPDGKRKKGVAWHQTVTWDLGFIWERALEMAYKDKLGIRPGEIELDKIVGSPDGIADDPWNKVDYVDTEYKLTWRSSARPIQDNWYYMRQFMGYCHMMETNVALVRVLYVWGNWKGSGPQYVVYRVEYSRKELENNWKYLRTHAEVQGWI